MPEPGWSIIVHGGAKSIADDRADANRTGCLKAVKAGAAILEQGGSAVEAVETAIRVLEADRTFNAGFGAVPGEDGRIELDAAIMDGDTLDIGAVAAARTIAYPIEAARKLLAHKSVLLSGEGADRFALEHGLELRPIPDPGEADDGELDTVGCVARDRQGHLAAGTSTGGLEGQRAGRVGDSPLPGCGLYADDSIGAVSLSGEGESIMRVMLAARMIFALESQDVGEAAKLTLARLDRVGGEAGIIALDRGGRFGIVHNSDHFALALADAETLPRAAIHRNELEDILGV